LMPSQNTRKAAQQPKRTTSDLLVSSHGMDD